VTVASRALLVRSIQWARRLPVRARHGLPTALVVEVPEAESVAGPLRAELDPAARAGIPAHITVLSPFLSSRRLGASDMNRLTALFAAVPSFAFRLASLGSFPEVTYLAPTCPRSFVDLTERTWREWPECPPFGGLFPEIVPHLTLADGPHDPAAVRAAVAPSLPVEAFARGVTLLRQLPNGRWLAQGFFPFGPAVPAA
jgi:hypothetical protein